MKTTDSIYKKIFFCILPVLLIYFAMYNTAAAVSAFLIAPALIAYISCTMGVLSAFLTACASVIFNLTAAYCTGLAPLLPSALTCVYISLPGLVCGICISMKLKIRDTLIAVAASHIIMPIILLVYLRLGLKLNLSEIISDAVTTNFVRQFEVIKSVYPELSEYYTLDSGELLPWLAIVIPGIIPGFLIIICFVLSVYLTVVSRGLCRRFFVRNCSFSEGLDCFAMPKSTVLVIAGTMVLSAISEQNIVQMAAVNIILVLFSLYALEGLSLAEYALKQQNLNALLRLFSMLIIVIVSTVLSAFIPIINAPFVLILIGISDSAADFRKLNTNKDEFNEN